jgi:hypothetical protein
MLPSPAFRVIATSVNVSNDSIGVRQQPRNASMSLEDVGPGPWFILIDHGTKSTQPFDPVLAAGQSVPQRQAQVPGEFRRPLERLQLRSRLAWRARSHFPLSPATRGRGPASPEAVP